MSITTLSARDFNQKLGKAKKLALNGPVFVTERGRQTHVLLDVEEYRKITAARRPSIAELLYDPRMSEVDPDFEFEKAEMDFRPAEFD